MKKNNNNFNFCFKLNNKPEKIIMTSALSIAGAILFDQKKKKKKHPEKYQNFFKRTKRNYRITNSLLTKAFANNLKTKKVIYHSDTLNNLSIEKGEFIDL